jgi:predicted dehydrogenase
VIGAGFIGRVHMQTFGEIDGAEVVGCTDAALELAAAAAKQYTVPRVFESADELINSPDVDAVVVAVPNRMHAPLTVQALAAGKHVLCEKPMALNGDAAREIVAAQRASGKTAMVAHQMRWLAAPQEAKRLVEAGELGEVYNAKCGMMRRKNIPGWGSWFTRMAESGGGPLIDLGVHVLDMAIWLMGNPRPVSVFGSTYAKFGPEKRGLGSWGTPQWDGIFDVEDLATAMIKMDNGSTLTLDVSWAANTKSDNQHWVDLMGTEGGVSIRGDELTLTTQKFDRPIDVDTTPSLSTGARPMLAAHFVESIQNDTQPISDVVSGLVNNTILDAIYESAKSGKAVDLDWGFLDD